MPGVTVPGSKGFSDIAVSPDGSLWATGWSEGEFYPHATPEHAVLMHFIPGACGKQ